MGLSLPHLIVLALVVLLLFGRGRISEMMGDFGKGIKSFKDGVADETTNRPITPPAQLTAQPVQPSYPQPSVMQPSVIQAPVMQPHAEVVGQQTVQPAAQTAAQPMLNGEPLPEYAEPNTPR